MTRRSKRKESEPGANGAAAADAAAPALASRVLTAAVYHTLLY